MTLKINSFLAKTVQNQTSKAAKSNGEKNGSTDSVDGKVSLYTEEERHTQKTKFNFINSKQCGVKKIIDTSALPTNKMSTHTEIDKKSHS